MDWNSLEVTLDVSVFVDKVLNVVGNTLMSTEV